MLLSFKLSFTLRHFPWTSWSRKQRRTEVNIHEVFLKPILWILPGDLFVYFVFLILFQRPFSSNHRTCCVHELSSHPLVLADPFVISTSIIWLVLVNDSIRFDYLGSLHAHNGTRSLPSRGDFFGGVIIFFERVDYFQVRLVDRFD